MDTLTVGTTLYSNVSLIRNLTGDCGRKHKNAAVTTQVEKVTAGVGQVASTV